MAHLPNNAKRIKLATLALEDNYSCRGCAYLYYVDNGYSNYTVESTSVYCALDRNKNLPAEQPWDWHPKEDNWPATNRSICEEYEETIEHVHYDVDGEYSETDFAVSEDVRGKIAAHHAREK